MSNTGLSERLCRRSRRQRWIGRRDRTTLLRGSGQDLAVLSSTDAVARRDQFLEGGSFSVVGPAVLLNLRELTVGDPVDVIARHQCFRADELRDGFERKTIAQCAADEPKPIDVF